MVQVELQPHRDGFWTWNVLFTWYSALQRAGVPCDVISKDAKISKYKLIIAPCLHLADESLAARLQNYVKAGGLLVLGIRSGFKTPTNQVSGDPLPGALRELVGATVSTWQTLPPKVPQSVALLWHGWQRVNATRWIETLEPESAGTIASYTGSNLDGRTAMTANQIGQGRVMYVGWLPNQKQADMLVGMLVPEAGIEPVGMLPHGVIAGKRVRDGEMFIFLLNFTDEEMWHGKSEGMKEEVSGIESSNEVSIPPGVRVTCLEDKG